MVGELCLQLPELLLGERCTLFPGLAVGVDLEAGVLDIWKMAREGQNVECSGCNYNLAEFHCLTVNYPLYPLRICFFNAREWFNVRRKTSLDYFCTFLSLCRLHAR